MLSTVTQTINGASQVMRQSGRYFRLLDTAGVTVDVEFGRALKMFEKLEAVEAGAWYRIPSGQEDFDSIRITTPSSAAIKFVISDGEAGYDRLTISTIDELPSPIGSAHTPAGKTAGVASGTMLAANAARKYLLVQNQHASDDVYINTSGAAAVADKTSLRIPAGGVYEPLVAPVGAITMIRGGAADISLHVVEA